MFQHLTTVIRAISLRFIWIPCDGYSRSKIVRLQGLQPPILTTILGELLALSLGYRDRLNQPIFHQPSSPDSLCFPLYLAMDTQTSLKVLFGHQLSREDAGLIRQFLELISQYSGPSFSVPKGVDKSNYGDSTDNGDPPLLLDTTRSH